MEARTMGAKVLLLEDDVSLAGEMKAALAGVGCTVEVVRDGNAGLARAVSTRFDLIVASVELPGMNGFRLTNRLKKDPRIPKAPIFLVSGQPSTTFDEHRKLPTRAESYFHKPLIMAELIARVRANVPALAEDGGSEPRQELESAADEWEQVLDILNDEATEAPAAPPPAASAEHEKSTAQLHRELEEARASEARALTARADSVARLEREVSHWKERALSSSSKTSIAPGAVAHDELALRNQLVRKETKLARLTSELDQLKQANRELREKATRLEGDIPILKQALADLGRQNAEMEKLLSVARADKDQATRRALDLSRRLERVRPDIEQAEQALAHEQAERRAEGERGARALAEEKMRREAERLEMERLHTGELAARDAAHARKIRELVASHESAIAPLERKVTELTGQLENERNGAAQRELAHREEVLLEARTLRAEHIEALAVAERAFEHKHAVLRHELEAAQAKLRDQARKKIQEIEARLADSAREAAKRAAEAETRFEAELGQERKRAQALEQALHAEREARAEQLSDHAAALAEASAARDRERVAAEERELALHEHLGATAAERAREHAEELRRLQQEHESLVAALRRELTEADAQRSAEKAAAEAEIEASRAERRSDLDRLRSENERARSSLEARYEHEIAALRAERDAAVERAIEAAEQQVRQTTERFSATERELRETSAALEERWRAEKDAELRAKLEELETAHARRVSEIEVRANEELEKARHDGYEAAREVEGAGRQRVREIEAERDARVRALEDVVTALERDRDRHADTARALDGAERALEVERASRASELEAHRAALALLAQNHEAELGETRQRLRELETLHAATLEARETAASDELQRTRADHDRIVTALQNQLDEALGNAERARAERDALERSTREESEAKERAAAASHADSFALAERRFEARVSDLLREQDEQLAALARKYELGMRELEGELEQKTRESRDAALGRDRAVAEIASLVEHASRERNIEMSALRAGAEKELAEAARKHEIAIADLSRAHQAALAAEGQRAKRDARKEAESQFEERIGRAMEELRTELELERAQTFAQMERTHSAALRRVMENGERERATLSARVSELDRLLESRGAEPPQASALDRPVRDASVERLDALVRSRVLDVVRLERELDEARAEVPALEAEIAALRTELTSMRLELDDQAVQVRVSKDELEQEHRRLGHAEDALAAALARIDANGGSRT